MDDDELARLAEVAAQIAENENHWRSVAREKAEPATLEDIEAIRNLIDGDMLRDWDASYSIQGSLPFLLDGYIRWSRGELVIDLPPAVHKAVGQFLSDLFMDPDPRKLIRDIKNNMAEHRNPETAQIIRCMQSLMEDYGLPTTRAIEQTMELLGIESDDRIKKVWQRSCESIPFKRVRCDDERSG